MGLRTFLRAAALGAVIVLTGPGRGLAAEGPEADAGAFRPHKLERTVRVTMGYLLYLPPDYHDRPSWPLLLTLHGSGERGDDLERVKANGPPKLIAAGRHFPFIVVSPQAPADGDWHAPELLALVDEVSETHRVDPDRVYVTGLSMGGYGAWSLAAYAPDRFAALVPICGGGNPDNAGLLSRMPTWVFHGAMDTVVPISASLEMVHALRQANGQVKFTVYADAGHDAWTQAYDDPALYTWLLQQRRTPR